MALESERQFYGSERSEVTFLFLYYFYPVQHKLLTDIIQLSTRHIILKFPRDKLRPAAQGLGGQSVGAGNEKSLGTEVSEKVSLFMLSMSWVTQSHWKDSKWESRGRPPPLTLELTLLALGSLLAHTWLHIFVYCYVFKGSLKSERMAFGNIIVHRVKPFKDAYIYFSYKKNAFFLCLWNYMTQMVISTFSVPMWNAWIHNCSMFVFESNHNAWKN